MTTDGWLRSRSTMFCASFSSWGSATATLGGRGAGVALGPVRGWTPATYNQQAIMRHTVGSYKSVARR